MELKHEIAPIELFPPVEESSTVTVSVARRDYAASALCRAVEDADAQVLNLNVTGQGDAMHVVAQLRVGVREPHRVVRSLERYGYEVLETHSMDGREVDEALSARAAQVLRWIEM